MTQFSAADRPRVAAGHRLQWEAAQEAFVLLYPEGMVKLNASAGQILARCDGERDVRSIVIDLEGAFGATGLEQEVLAFLDMALVQRWVSLA